MLSRKMIVVVSMAIGAVPLAAAIRIYFTSPARGLPFRASFDKYTADHWTAYGGTWEVVDGSMRNDSDERGAKSYSGYYAGIRTLDNALTLGRVEHGFEEYPIKAMPAEVQPFRWYHLTLSVAGCDITATAMPAQGGTRVVNHVQPRELFSFRHNRAEILLIGWSLAKSGCTLNHRRARSHRWIG